MKLEEIFNKAARHLMHMDRPSMDEDADMCVYRGYGEDCGLSGSRCAVGLFIADEYYDEGFEGSGLSEDGYWGCDSLSIAKAVAKSWGQQCLTPSQLRLLSQLQKAHDSNTDWPADQWKISVVKGLDEIANNHDFQFDPAHINPHYKGDAI